MTLADMVPHYQTDKAANPRLCENYERIFAPKKNAPIRLLELGIAQGGSLLMWRDYFPHGYIVGLDLNPPAALADEERIQVFSGNQANRELLKVLSADYAPHGWDFIIDDCAHVGERSRVSFLALWPRLKSGGFYCIEDWGTGYFPTWEDGESFTPNHSAGMVGFVKSLIDELAAGDYTATLPGRGVIEPARYSDIKSLHFTFGHCIAEKF